jgi:hypothetical protein
LETFTNRDPAYVKWVEDHPAGFLLNLKTENATTAMVHTTRCGHFYPLELQLNQTRKTKVCSERLSDLESWAKEHRFSVRECSTCHPYAPR